MNAKNRDANLYSDWPHYLRDDPSFPHSERSNRHLRRNRKRIVEAVTALFTVDPRLELDDLVVSLAGCHHLSQRTVSDHIINRTGFYMRPKHGDCLGRVSLKRPTIPMPGDFHTTESRDFPNVTPLQLAPITCGRSLSPACLSRINLVGGRLLRYPIVTHLRDDAGERLCPCESGPALEAAANHDGTCNVKVRFCPNCARVALAPIVELVQSRCADDPLLNAILSFTTTLEEDLHILAPAPVELAVYVGKSGGAR